MKVEIVKSKYTPTTIIIKGYKMSSRKSQKLRQSILKYNTEMSKLKDELASSQEANLKYNRLVIKKAVCKKELDTLKGSVLQKIINKFLLNKTKEKLICDYFKS